jgi:hypothetical protein
VICAARHAFLWAVATDQTAGGYFDADPARPSSTQDNNVADHQRIRLNPPKAVECCSGRHPDSFSVKDLFSTIGTPVRFGSILSGDENDGSAR